MARFDGHFLVDPLDTVWLRGGKPFLAGEDSADFMQFPPSPWTWQGLVRTRLLRAALSGDLDAADPRQVRLLIGEPDALPSGWQLRGPFPARPGAQGLEPWVPRPALLVESSEGPVALGPMPEAATVGLLTSDWPGSGRWPRVRNILDKQPKTGWISASNLAWALTGRGTWDKSGSTSEELPPFVSREPRPGVQIDDNTATASDHMLYVAEHLRFAPGCGLLGGFSGTVDAPADALRTGAGFIGRKSRLVSFQDPGSVSPVWEALLRGDHTRPSTPVPDPLGVWVVLLTPAEVGEAPIPFALPTSVNISLELSLARAGQPVGGFDRVGGGGRPVRGTIAAGSAWLFRVHGGSSEDRLLAARALQGLHPHTPTDLERLGFGQRLAALCDLDTWRPLAHVGA